MEEIEKFVKALQAKKRKSTIISFGMVLAGIALISPSWTSGTKAQETLFCYSTNNINCSGSILRGISWIVKEEMRNYVFDSNIKVIKDVEPDHPYLPIYTIAGACASITAYLVSKSATSDQEKSIHSEFTLLKISALSNDIASKSHLEVVRFAKDHQSKLAMESILRESEYALNSMKSDDEIFFDTLSGRMGGELSAKSHDLRLAEIEKEILNNRLCAEKSAIEISKIKNKHADPKDPAASSADLAKDLVSALESHEYGYLWNIIKSLKPLWLIGNQGSGKTYTATSIALIRMHCLSAPVCQLIDRHATGDNAEVWKLLNPSTKAESEDEISNAFDKCRARWMQRIKEKPPDKQQIIVDEFTNLKSLCGDSAVSFFKMSLTDTRKAKEYLLGITHNATNESFPDGTASARKSGTILLEKFSANGETPLSRVVVRYGMVDEKGNNLEDVEKTIPDWFHPQKIHDHFNGKPIAF
jgi:hypothetical protein